MAKYSIIIPLYNKGSRVRRSIDSVLNQGYWDMEIIVVDDGSTDNSAEYVKAYDDSRIRYIFKENGGVSSARNTGIRAASGEWLLLLDADDELLPGSIAVYEEMARKYPHATVLVQQMSWTNQSNGNSWLFQRIRVKTPSFATCTPNLALWLNLYMIGPRNYCFKQNLLEHAGMFDTRMSFWEDFDFARRLIRHQTIAISAHIGARYNQEASGLSGTPHPLACDMAYYLPEILSRERTTFGERVMLYEILEHHLYWWTQRGNDESAAFYREMQSRLFVWYFKYIHWARQQLSKHKVI
ncbi:MAG: glycosyltransferase [Alloprevotella sp.]|nr:glycosyltransferase [Alloprevotella sp.]